MNDKELWEQHKLFQGRKFLLEDKQQEDFRKILILQRNRIKRGKEIINLKNKIRSLYGKQSLKTNDEIRKEVNGNNE